jgi:uncharacterized protein (UPF0332 family)
MSWRDIADDNFASASQLKASENWRSCISRAYYAAFSVVTQELIIRGLTPRVEYGTWAHQSLPMMLQAHLNSSSETAAANLASALERLYRLRLIADYRPELRVGRREAFVATGLMSQVFRGVA